jgi:hypothetical protein
LIEARPAIRPGPVTRRVHGLAGAARAEFVPREGLDRRQSRPSPVNSPEKWDTSSMRRAENTLP